jgi:tetratricopeptide (TPR) repeat protein
MKKFLLLSLLTICLEGFSQTAIEWYNKGNEKLTSGDHAGSIRDYDRALVMDANFTDAYYNRGTSKLYLKNYSGAVDDFTKAIQLKPGFVSAYINRANARMSLQDTKNALEDFNEVIKLDQTIAVVYLMRGQIKLNMDDREGGCADLKKSKELGDKRADNIIKQFCEGMNGKESLKFDLPPNETWKNASDQENDQQHVIEMLRSNESLQKWSEMVTMVAIKGVTGVPVETAMNMMLDQAKKEAPQAKLSFIEKDEKADHPWILFTIESPSFKNDKNPESQLWYIVQGKQALYTNFWAIKKAVIPADQKEKWMRTFKSGRVVVRQK